MYLLGFGTDPEQDEDECYEDLCARVCKTRSRRLHIIWRLASRSRSLLRVRCSSSLPTFVSHTQTNFFHLISAHTRLRCVSVGRGALNGAERSNGRDGMSAWVACQRQDARARRSEKNKGNNEREVVRKGFAGGLRMVQELGVSVDTRGQATLSTGA